MRLLKLFKPSYELFEVDFPTVKPKVVCNHILRDGVCLLRNTIPKEILLRYRGMVEKFYEEIVGAMNSGVRFDNAEQVHIMDKRFTERYGVENSLFNLFNSPKLDAILGSIFGEGRYQRAYLDSYTRSIDGKKLNQDRTSFNPLNLHLDGLYHNYYRYFAINFWIPFEECGKNTLAPGFAAYPMNFEEVRKIIGFETLESLEKEMGFMKTGNEDSPMSVSVTIPKILKVAQKNGIKMLAPHFKLGDVMMINSWTPHGSFFEPSMTKHRRNVELRFHGDSWNPLSPVF